MAETQQPEAYQPAPGPPCGELRTHRETARDNHRREINRSKTDARRTKAHSIRFALDFKNGPANDVVRIFVDGKKMITGTTWEDYYRYDPEAAGNGNQVPTVAKLLFREGGNAADAISANAGKGFLADGVSLKSSAGYSRDNGGGRRHGHSQPGK